MRRPRLIAITALVLVMAGCGPSLSAEFRRDGSYAYELIESASSGSTVLKTDVEKAIAQAKADARSDDERKAVMALENFLLAFRYSEETPLDKRWVEVCRWEAGQWLDRKVFVLRAPKRGDCSTLSNLHTEHLTRLWKCKESDSELNELESRLKAVPDGRPFEWLKANKLVEDRKKIVDKKCADEALAADPKDLP